MGLGQHEQGLRAATRVQPQHLAAIGVAHSRRLAAAAQQGLGKTSQRIQALTVGRRHGLLGRSGTAFGHKEVVEQAPAVGKGLLGRHAIGVNL